jgi:hypothetical protein
MRFLRTDAHAPPDTGYLEEVRARRKDTLTKVEGYTPALAAKKEERRILAAAVFGRGIATLRVPRRGRQSRTRTRSHICCVARWDQLLEKAKQLEALVTERANAITQAAKGRQLHDERESHIRHIRQKNEGAVHRLSQRFDAVIRELVPGEIEGGSDNRWQGYNSQGFTRR